MIDPEQVVETKRRIATMQAWLDGKTIERFNPDDGWRAIDEPLWSWNCVNYRVQPEPRVAEGWINAKAFTKGEDCTFYQHVDNPLMSCWVRARVTEVTND